MIWDQSVFPYVLEIQSPYRLRYLVPFPEAVLLEREPGTEDQTKAKIQQLRSLFEPVLGYTKPMIQWALKFRQMLNYPRRVLAVCSIFFIVTLLLNGTIWKLWGLHQDQYRLTEEIQGLRLDLAALDLENKKVRDPNYIERQARDKLDMVGDNELLFVFPAE